MKTEPTTDWTVPFLLVALWIPAMLAASYGWRHGEYYDYGWFVPPVALWLFIRRWKNLGSSAPLSWRLLILTIGILMPWLLVLRILDYADPSWRMPMWLLALTAALVSHGLIAFTHGWRSSFTFLWITLLALSAIPWPSALEHRLIEKLTSGVIHTVGEWFQFSGRPVEIEGDRIHLHDITVEVTDGCSGVRSFQSFVMVTWFFAELQRMRSSRVIILLLSACAAAFVVNTARTWTLATIRFDYGVDAFNRSHSWLGWLSFLVSGTFFYFISGWLSESKPRRTLRKLTKKIDG